MWESFHFPEVKMLHLDAGIFTTTPILSGTLWASLDCNTQDLCAFTLLKSQCALASSLAPGTPPHFFSLTHLTHRCMTSLIPGFPIGPELRGTLFPNPTCYSFLWVCYFLLLGPDDSWHKSSLLELRKKNHTFFSM